jgi:hypothetical protein
LSVDATDWVSVRLGKWIRHSFLAQKSGPALGEHRSGKQFAADCGRRAHFAVGLGYTYCLANDSTIICVELCVRSDGLAVRRSEMVDFAYQLAVVVEALHDSSFWNEQALGAVQVDVDRQSFAQVWIALLAVKPLSRESSGNLKLPWAMLLQ